MREYLITDTFPLGKSGVSVTFDANKYTPALRDRMTSDFLTRLEDEARGLGSDEDSRRQAEELAREVDRQLCADALAVDRGGILKAWGMTGAFRRPTLAALLKLPQKFPTELFAWARNRSLPKAAVGPDPFCEQPDDGRDYMRWLVNPNHPNARRPAYVDEHDIARFWNLPPWEWANAPEHYIEEARVIMAARRSAALSLTEKTKAVKVLVLSPDLFVGG